jgi:DNA-binding PadR family transcriptional regulator
MENKTAYVLLGLLNHEPLTGYQMRKRIEISLGRFWDAGFGQIYPTLQHLAQEGLVSREAGGGEGRRERKVYAITARGREVLGAWLAEPAAREYVRYEVLLKLFFGSLVPVDRSIETLEAFRARYEGEPELMERFAAELRAALPQSPDHLYYLLTVLFGQHVYRAYLAWADEALALLRSQTAGITPGQGE